MTTDWIFLIPSTVYSRITGNFPSDTKKLYGMTDDNFSTVAKSKTDAVFPFVFIKELPATELGKTLGGDSINGGLFTFQIDVIDNQSQCRARNVMKEVVKIMKSMRFSANEMPSFDDSQDEYRCTARFQRAIGFDDIL